MSAGVLLFIGGLAAIVILIGLLAVWRLGRIEKHAERTAENTGSTVKQLIKHEQITKGVFDKEKETKKLPGE